METVKTENETGNDKRDTRKEKRQIGARYAYDARQETKIEVCGKTRYKAWETRNKKLHG